MINGYAKNRANVEAFELFNQMCRGDEPPDDFTLSTLSKLCGEIGASLAGKSIHSKSIRSGYVSDTVVSNSIMFMYLKSGALREVHKVFDEMRHRSSSSYNVMIALCGASGEPRLNGAVWGIVRDMQIEGIRPDSFTVSSLLPLCGKESVYGRELHCYILKNEMDLDSVLHAGCCLIDMYCRNNKVTLGRQVFNQMKFRNVYAWTAMINGYTQSPDPDEALVLFRNMQVMDGIEPNKITLVSVLPACTVLGGLMTGNQIHGFAIRKELNRDVSLSNALIDMYSKCGSLDYAMRVFEDGSFCKDAISWSSMISGCGLHGKGQEALHLYEKMLQLGMRPDNASVVGVLSACGRSGLVNEGLRIYTTLVKEYGLKPSLEICACVVDILGRSGQLELALDFIKTMSVDPGPSIWGALVSASITHGNAVIRDLAYGFLINVEPENPSNYITLSNSYAYSRRWDVVAEVRTLMREKRLQKFPGCSWISINGTTHRFYVANVAHPCANSIREMLQKLMSVMQGAKFSPRFELLM